MCEAVCAEPPARTHASVSRAEVALADPAAPGETGPDGAWRSAVFVVTGLMMLFMKFIDPICIAPRVPGPISHVCPRAFPRLSIYARVPAANPRSAYPTHARTHKHTTSTPPPRRSFPTPGTSTLPGQERASCHFPHSVLRSNRAHTACPFYRPAPLPYL